MSEKLSDQMRRSWVHLKRGPSYKTPSTDEMDKYRPLKSVHGDIVGYTCVQCGRLREAPHKDDCSLLAKPEAAKEK